ncbi:hypothetical protein EAS64_14785 [Trebonia kvetii]|uniref:Uncharacterized protein n=1 Tax=Trebonia kvetii TaxID=2480626 RepID=A0A6P2BZW3_9ACTN|nr:hypothetical protein [Trebonia kvetii]TVZ03731.1 hypothetical protein EAS64_14785 [Trebonia kvetii]
MALTLLDDAITSDSTPHTAWRVHGEEHLWRVSSLPGRSMDRYSALTAVILADLTSGDIYAGHPRWSHLECFAAELGLTVPDVLILTASANRHTDAGKNAVSTDPEAAG